ncbi:hypothetical protein [Paenibacillus sp. MER TA 81-3]|uniref:hypothetical protein n=1 Tax=Paenibacillus sp. MER TA 81-3 TaxID=2939573 RepID=UPI00203AED19|nr:hypothetical protein [Paenibacillus sp. MER TA 81-3]
MVTGETVNAERKGKDPFIKDKLMTDSAMEYLLRISLDGLKRVLRNNKFTMPDVTVTELEE